MSLSMYDASIPVFIRYLTNLATILDKGAAHAQAQGMDPQDLIQTRLVADMDPLPAQIQRASDAAKGCGAAWRALKSRRMRITKPRSRSSRSALPGSSASSRRSVPSSSRAASHAWWSSRCATVR